jgi:muconolactone D-isomerase
MEFLVEFDFVVPEGTPQSEVADREKAEAATAAKLAAEGRLIRVWRPLLDTGGIRVIALYHAESKSQLAGWLNALPLWEWMKNVMVTPLESHPFDPVAGQPPSESR